MLTIIFVFIAIYLIVKILKFFVDIIKFILGGGVIICVALIFISLIKHFYYIIIPVLLAIIAISIIYYVICYIKSRLSIRRWVREKVDVISLSKIDDILYPEVQAITMSDTNRQDYKYTIEQLPYGRVNAFLNYFNKSFDSEEIYYYSAVRSKIQNEIREYGTMVGRYGIYLLYQQKNSKSEYESKSKLILYSRMVSTHFIDNTLEIIYINLQNKSYTSYNINQSHTTIPLNSIKTFLDSIIQYKLPHIYYKKLFLTEDTILEKADQQYYQHQKNLQLVNGYTTGGVIASMSSFQMQYNENKNYMNASRGNGYGAEYANNTIDRVKGNNVVNLAQQLDENGRQVKHGADRLVNSQAIQTKYYKTAAESIGAAFEHKRAIYIYIYTR